MAHRQAAPWPSDRDRPMVERQAAGSEFFQTIGAAWKKTDKHGKTFFSILLPVNEE